MLFCYYVLKTYSVLDIEFHTEVITSDSWVSTTATTKSIVTLTVVRHLGDQEEVITIHIKLQACETEFLDPALRPCVSYLHVLQTEIRAVVKILRTIVIGNLRGESRNDHFTASVYRIPPKTIVIDSQKFIVEGSEAYVTCHARCTIQLGKAAPSLPFPADSSIVGVFRSTGITVRSLVVGLVDD